MAARRSLVASRHVFDVRDQAFLDLIDRDLVRAFPIGQAGDVIVADDFVAEDDRSHRFNTDATLLDEGAGIDLAHMIFALRGEGARELEFADVRGIEREEGFKVTLVGGGDISLDHLQRRWNGWGGLCGRRAGRERKREGEPNESI